MIYVLVIALVALVIQGTVMHGLFRLMRAHDREYQRREAVLLDRIMYMARMPWGEPPVVAPEEVFRPEDPVEWAESVTLEEMP